MTAYDVTVTREDNLWVADIAGLTAATDVEHVTDLDVEVRDLIAGLTDTDPEAFAINWRYGSTAVTSPTSSCASSPSSPNCGTCGDKRDAERLALLQDLAEAGLSQRAIGNAAGLSHQRVGQLIRN